MEYLSILLALIAVTNAAQPPFFRVEVEVINLDNTKGWDAVGSWCDMTSDCDPSVYASLDLRTPMAKFPGPKPVNTWPVIFFTDNVNSPKIGKSVTADVCGGAVENGNLRVAVYDSDNTMTTQLIGNFDCVFSISSLNFAKIVADAKFGKTLECKNLEGNGDRLKLYVRTRAYEIDASSCKLKDDAEVSTDGNGKRKGEHDFVRVQVELVKLNNPQGITYTKEACDSGSECDTYLTAALDVETPLAKWPGPKPESTFAEFVNVNNDNSPTINKVGRKDVCGGAINQANLRVHVQDADSFSYTLIEDFECLFNVNYRNVGPSQDDTEWSTVQNCKPQHPGHDIQLQFRYRVFDIASADCKP